MGRTLHETTVRKALARMTVDASAHKPKNRKVIYFNRMSFYKEEIPLARLNLWEILFFFNISQFFEFEHKFEI
jgi:hypothetical protein